MSQPFVSVIIPTYNYAHYIDAAIESILAQDYPTGQIEIIVVDDGSTDNTKEVMQPFVEKGVVQYYWQSNKGKANATVNAIKKCTGKYIFNLDADDYFFPGKIAESIKVFEADEDIVHVATGARYVNHDTGESADESLPAEIIDKPLNGEWLLDMFYKANILYGGGSTYGARASALKKIDIPDGVDMFIDEFLILAILPMGKSFFIRKPLSAWRRHSANYSVASTGYERSIKKEKRLLDSAFVVLDYIQQHHFNKTLLNIYRLKTATLEISFKETLGTKTYPDILKYAAVVFFKLRPGRRVMANYHVLNRLIPSTIFNLLKKIKETNLKPA